LVIIPIHATNGNPTNANSSDLLTEYISFLDRL